MGSEKLKMILHEELDLYQNVDKIKYEDEFVSVGDVLRAEKEIDKNKEKYFKAIWKNEIFDENYRQKFLGED